MAEFILNTEITTEVPTVEVTVSRATLLRVGLHRFQLIVRDDSNNDSLPETVEIRVFDNERPTAVLTGPPGGAAFGSSFQLSGANSTDLGGGRITQYRWTYLGPASPPPITVVRPDQPTIITRPTTPVVSPTITRPPS
jgi:hypothetical protein